MNVLQDETTGKTVLQIRGEVEQFFVVGDRVDMTRLQSTLDEGVSTVIAPKQPSLDDSCKEPCFRPTKCDGHRLFIV